MRAGLTCAQILGRRCLMTLRGKTALVTGGSRGIGRGIALKLAESGAKVAVHYYQKEDQAKATLEQLRACGSDGFVVQADVSKPEEIRRIFARVKSEFGSLDIFVNNARPEVPTFYEGPMAVSLDMFDFAMDSQAKAFLVGVREADPFMQAGGRIIARTYAPGGRFGSWQPGLDRRQCAEYSAAARAGHHPEVAAGRMDAHASTRFTCGHWKRGQAALLGRGKLDHRADAGGGRRRFARGRAPAARGSASAGS